MELIFLESGLVHNYLSNLLKQKNRDKGISDEEIIEGIDEVAKKLDKIIVRIVKETNS